MLLLQAFGQRLRAQDQRWVLILDPPIHIRKGYAPYDSGIKDNVFITDISGKPYVGQVSSCSIKQHAAFALGLQSNVLPTCRQ